MCLLVLAYKIHREYPLIVAANRDEFYSRPAEPMHFWKEHPSLLAGKDLKAGGTWMGITKNARFAAITNYRNPAESKPDAPSRGKLVLQFLLDSVSPKEFIQNLKNPDEYNGFNLIFGSIDALFYYSNITHRMHKIEPGIHGVSNALLNTPWYKIRRASHFMEELITKEDFINPWRLLDFLSDRQLSPVNELPDTGIDKEIELKLSSIFISTEKYGTRSSAVLLINRKGLVKVIERNYSKNGKISGEKEFIFNFDLTTDT